MSSNIRQIQSQCFIKHDCTHKRTNTCTLHTLLEFAPVVYNIPFTDRWQRMKSKGPCNLKIGDNLEQRFLLSPQIK